MNKSITNSKTSELDPMILNNLLKKYSEESSINKWDMGASSSRDISCLLYTSPSPRDRTRSRMPSSA